MKFDDIKSLNAKKRISLLLFVSSSSILIKESKSTDNKDACTSTSVVTVCVYQNLKTIKTPISK